ncbi:MAG: hypothetical protein JSV43_08660 [Methanobacteriota archaeon]|nr:MAG: hypothetical protein JSV43_08660 [Euryarchaeota archaeon]
MRDLSIDSKGLEGLPFRLLIVAVIMGISIPAVLASWSNAERQHLENSLNSELNYLTVRIVQVYQAGPGNVVTVDVNLESGTFTEIEYVLVGDNLESAWRTAIRWKLSGQGENVIAIEDGIPVCSNNGDALHLSPGWHSIYLETKKEESGLVFVEISVLD